MDCHCVDQKLNLNQVFSFIHLLYPSKTLITILLLISNKQCIDSNCRFDSTTPSQKKHVECLKWNLWMVLDGEQVFLWWWNGVPERQIKRYLCICVYISFIMPTVFIYQYINSEKLVEYICSFGWFLPILYLSVSICFFCM